MKRWWSLEGNNLVVFHSVYVKFGLIKEEVFGWSGLKKGGLL
jgi:hypothetical protein